MTNTCDEAFPASIRVLPPGWKPMSTLDCRRRRPASSSRSKGGRLRSRPGTGSIAALGVARDRRGIDPGLSRVTLRCGKLEAAPFNRSSRMSDLYPVPDAFAAQASITRADYERDYAESIRDPDAFWGRIAQRLEWIKPPTRIRDVSFDRQDFHIRWFADGELNASVNCLDRHLATRGDKTALIFEPDDPGAEP